MVSQGQTILLRLLAWIYGFFFAGLFLSTQFWAIYLITDRYGPDASYEVFVGVLPLTVVVLVVGTVLGVTIERSSSSPTALRRRVLVLWTATGLAVALAIPIAFAVAEHSDSGQWFLEHEKQHSNRPN